MLYVKFILLLLLCGMYNKNLSICCEMFVLSENGNDVNFVSRAQKYEVRLPLDFTCENCTLQLQREAGEWGSNYRFWSCADIDIVPRKYILLRYKS
jgi:hypothetical protein